MDIEDIKMELEKVAVKFTAGGFRPTNELTESWIGKVFLFDKNEGIPVDSNGNKMIPLAQICLRDLPYIPDIICDTELITLFISSSKLPEPFDEMGRRWVIREYSSVDALVRKNPPCLNSFIKPFPLRFEKVEKDFPLWDGGGVPPELEKEILALERSGCIDSYYDITEHCYDHKIGGYPSFCQSGVEFGDGYEFVLQISSDPKINFNVIDNGSLMFAKNRSTGEWVIYYDFF